MRYISSEGLERKIDARTTDRVPVCKCYRSVKKCYKCVVNLIKEVQPSTPWGTGVQDRGWKGVARKPEPAKRAADPGLSMDCGAIRAAAFLHTTITTFTTKYISM